MIRGFNALVLGAVFTVAACGRGDSKAADTTLSSDLSLAAQQQKTALDSLSPAERAALASSSAPGAHQVTHTSTASAPVAHHRVRSSSGTTTSSSSGTVTTTTTSSGGTVVKHPQRDAAIGAAAGAVIGATTSRNKVKGGLIGAAVGGILGGVIGNNVDKKKKP
jgi:hypothetical protein